VHHREGKRHPHQYRLPKKCLSTVHRKLQGLGLSERRTFDELHEAVGQCRDIRMFGELTQYDVATRVGAYLNLWPEKVYLHAGTRKGARALGLAVRGRAALEMSELPQELRLLEPWQVEDFLCLHKAELRRLTR
jgi:hypothetical protein